MTSTRYLTRKFFLWLSCIGSAMAIAFLCFVIYFGNANLLVWVNVGVVLLYSVVFPANTCGYPEVTDKYLIHRNLWYRFYAKKYDLDTIDWVELGMLRGPSRICRIYIKGARLREKRIILDSLDSQSVMQFIDDLRARGVEVRCPYSGKNVV